MLVRQGALWHLANIVLVRDVFLQMVAWVVGQVMRTQVEVRVVDTQQQGVWVMIGYQLVRLVRTGQQLVRLRHGNN